jgi:L-ribulose-5-phosphate 3-epimerase
MMTPKIHDEKSLDSFRINRRAALRSTITAAGVALVAPESQSAGANHPAVANAPDPRKSAPKSYRMKKSINLWAFPYPQRM